MGCCASREDTRWAQNNTVSKEEFDKKLDLIFQRYDKNKNGVLEQAEMKMLLHDVTNGRTISDKQLQHFMKKCDKNSDGVVQRN